MYRKGITGERRKYLPALWKNIIFNFETEDKNHRQSIHVCI